MKRVQIFTDGACSPNPGPGGWGAILHLNGTDIWKEIGGGYRMTTNNRMEILAAIHALERLKEPCEIQLFSDSQYLCNSIQKGWAYRWEANGFLKKGKPVPNADLWKRLLKHLEAHKGEFIWVKGHAGNPANERCDAIATSWARQKELPSDYGYEAREELGLLLLQEVN